MSQVDRTCWINNTFAINWTHLAYGSWGSFKGVWYAVDVLQEVLFASVALITLLIHHNNTMAPCKSDFFLGLRNVNRSKTCHRIPAFSLFFQNIVQKANGITVVHYSKCVSQKTIILMCCGVSVDSSSLLARSNLPAATSAMPWQLLPASSSPSSNSSITKLIHQASSSLNRPDFRSLLGVGRGNLTISSSSNLSSISITVIKQSQP